MTPASDCQGGGVFNTVGGGGNLVAYWDMNDIVGTTAVFFFLANTAKLPTYYLARQFEYAEIGFTVRFLPFVVLGAIAGFWLVKKFTNQGYLRFVSWATFAKTWKKSVSIRRSARFL